MPKYVLVRSTPTRRPNRDLAPQSSSFSPASTQIHPPAPTIPPSASALHHALIPRDSSPATCGWVSGRANEPYTCNAGSSCVFNSLYSIFGCCSGDISTCSLQTACYPRSSTSSTADGYTRVCSDASAPVCQQFYFPLGYSSYGCAGTSASAVRLSHVVLSGTSEAVGVTTGVFPATGKGTAAAKPSATAGSGGSGGGGSNTDSNNGSNNNNGNTNTNISNVGGSSITTTTSSGSPSLPVGAIVGIVVGGIALLAMIAVCSICFRRRRAHHIPPSANPPNAPNYAFPTTHMGPAAGALASPQSSASYPTQPYPFAEPGKQLTRTNVTAHNHNQMGPSGGWDGVDHGMAGVTRYEGDDGIWRTEIYPHEAVDERGAGMQQQQHASVVGTQMAPTAVAATQVSHHVQGV